MNALDYSIVALYFAAMIGLGIRYRHRTTVDDYFLGGKTFGWFTLCMSSCG
jgi:Na+/proline symporter